MQQCPHQAARPALKGTDRPPGADAADAAKQQKKQRNVRKRDGEQGAAQPQRAQAAVAGPAERPQQQGNGSRQAPEEGGTEEAGPALEIGADPPEVAARLAKEQAAAEAAEAAGQQGATAAAAAAAAGPAAKEGQPPQAKKPRVELNYDEEDFEEEG